jgi:outer membrane protein assembly factor BamD (BamD/ComL family)
MRRVWGNGVGLLALACALGGGGCAADRFNFFARSEASAKAPADEKDHPTERETLAQKEADNARRDEGGGFKLVNFVAPWKWFEGKVEAPAGPADSLVLRGDKLEEDVPSVKSKASAEMEGAKELYRRGEYAQAEPLFRHIADNTKNSVTIAEEARYYQADCLRLLGRYPRASEAYYQVLELNGQFRELANQRLFDIANFWLDDTRAIMRAYDEQKEGKRWFVWPMSFVHFEKSKPLLDEEGHALEKLEQVRIHDPSGSLGERALFFLGTVRFFRQDYLEADHYFHELVTNHPNSDKAAQALEMSIICKQLCTGGSAYDGRKCAEARQLVDMAVRSYPELANKKSDFLERQLYSINQQQADRDFGVAEFYRRIGHPGSAYFYYEIVRRRYPGTKYFDRATERMHELRGQLDKEKAEPMPPPLPGTQGADKTPGPQPEMLPTPRPLTPGTPLMQPEPETAPPPRPFPSGLLKGGR